MNTERAEALRHRMHEGADSLGNLLVEGFHYLALFAIGGVTAWAAIAEFLLILAKNHISVDDVLLLFIYLELGAMVGIYFKTNHMPVRFLIYVAITALTRLLIADISHHSEPDMGIVYITGAILLLAFANLVVRYASSRYPSVENSNMRSKLASNRGETATAPAPQPAQEVHYS
ncbi:PsiE family protein [Pokkaliibacter plantistimulans]|uniref:Protein PsiE n=1 Tax=Pokkaliibacter plantistimulans TaxID=1635171 RepID=A0ABX5M3U4_9GAMM|nr:phosphate-starvation-inducible PsiE family protein [Pokkaliibacter plantistimulans]PXF31575.1 PsiE family protein [Pokkaliibacter plantistimulans]